MKSICFFLTVLAFSNALAQGSGVEKRIRETENNLIPYVPVAGFKGWNLLDRMKYYHVQGVSIAVINDFKIDWAKGYGMADTLRKMPVTTNTMFSAGSVSKFVAAAMALHLVERGKLNLDSPINKFLKSWKITDNEFTRKKPVTLRMLLSHTAGTSQSSYFGFTPDKNPLPGIVEILNGAPGAESRPVVVNSEPGKEFRYSGGGTIIAQLAMMDVSGTGFSALARKIVFDPLAMANSTFEQPVPAQYRNRTSWGYSEAPWFKGMPYVYPQQAAAGLYTTPTDLAKFFIEIQKSYRGKSKLLSRDLARIMMTPQASVSTGGYKEQIGIGPFLIERAGNTETKGVYFEFTGVNAGFLAYGIASLTEGNGAVIMLNSGDDVNGLGKEIRRAIAKVYGWYKFLPDEVIPVNLPDDELTTYEGRYRKGQDEVVLIRKEKNYLVETINGGQEIYCFPVRKDTIVFTDFNVRGWFGHDTAGHVNSLQTQWQEKPMKKMGASEFTPSEYLKLGRYSEAKEGFRSMNLNEYQLTYLAYNHLHQKQVDLKAVHTILVLAQEQHPNSSVVYARWADYYTIFHDKENTMLNLKKAVSLDPNDEQSKEALRILSKGK